MHPTLLKLTVENPSPQMPAGQGNPGSIAGGCFFFFFSSGSHYFPLLTNVRRLPLLGKQEIWRYGTIEKKKVDDNQIVR